MRERSLVIIVAVVFFLLCGRGLLSLLLAFLFIEEGRCGDGERVGHYVGTAQKRGGWGGRGEKDVGGVRRGRDREKTWREGTPCRPDQSRPARALLQPVVVCPNLGTPRVLPVADGRPVVSGRL